MNKDSPHIIHFPTMLGSLLPESLKRCAHFLNPGMYGLSGDYYLPDNLVLDASEVKSFISQGIEFGEQFAKPSDMAYLGAAKMDDFYSGTSQSLGWQISTYGQKKAGGDDYDQLLRAQQLLILEYVFEKNIAELNDLDSRLGSTWNEFDTSLGIERNDEDFRNIDRSSIVFFSPSANWKKLLWAFTHFIPDNVRLLILDRQIADELEGSGVAWESCDPEQFLVSFPAEAGLFKGVLRSGQYRTYPGRICKDLDLLKLGDPEN